VALTIDEILFGIAIVNALTAIVGTVSTVLALRTYILTHKIEVATNSMQDELVRVTGIAAHAAGKEESRLAGEHKAAALAEKTKRK
jgi:hypothetical protein